MSEIDVKAWREYWAMGDFDTPALGEAIHDFVAENVAAAFETCMSDLNARLIMGEDDLLIHVTGPEQPLNGINDCVVRQFALKELLQNFAENAFGPGEEDVAESVATALEDGAKLFRKAAIRS